MIDNSRWSQFSFFEQMGHIGSEISRARIWQERKEAQACNRCIERAFDLVDLSMADKRWRGRLKELCRLREFLADQYGVTRHYQVSLNDLEHYCMAFALLLRKN